MSNPRPDLSLASKRLISRYWTDTNLWCWLTSSPHFCDLINKRVRLITNFSHMCCHLRAVAFRCLFMPGVGEGNYLIWIDARGPTPWLGLMPGGQLLDLDWWPGGQFLEADWCTGAYSLIWINAHEPTPWFGLMPVGHLLDLDWCPGAISLIWIDAHELTP